VPLAPILLRDIFCKPFLICRRRFLPQHRELLDFLTALSSSSVSLLLWTELAVEWWCFTHLDCDGLSPFILKNCICVSCEPRKIIFNDFISTGVLTRRWKLVTVSPIFNSGFKAIVLNYRPIAKLSNVSNMFERIVANQLTFFADRIISSNQHGFMPGR